jgi:meso-butanediol dehydrogenase/(S,S)-butanediol dehydrogenase/diacetyl reductase
MPHLSGKNTVITGGAAGIGRACALAYAKAGARVIIGDIDPVEGAKTVAMIEAAKGVARFVRADVGRSEDCRHLIAEAVRQFGGVDILHANAGMELCKSVWDTTDADWERVVSVNLSGAFYCCREAMMDMRRRAAGGAILLTASPHAYMTGRDIAAYAATKGGMAALTRALAIEGAPLGIRVNALLPGAIETPMMHREVAFAADPAAQLQRFAEAHPLGRMGQPEDVAKMALFVVSDDAGFVTGACLAVDGGLMACLNAGPILAYKAE